MTTVEVRLWGTPIGAVSWDRAQRLGAFAYARAFLSSGIQVAPLCMPLGPDAFRFPELSRSSFQGLPGLLADSLPDRFGNALINAWLAAQGRRPEDFDPVERLAYTGKRGMGALEFVPALETGAAPSAALDVGALVELAGEVLSQRDDFHTHFGEGQDEAGLAQLLAVGTSAGGARAKAVIAWNPSTNEVRSGQVEAPAGFEHWLLKFDGVRGNRDRELEDPDGFGLIEYAYFCMARAAGIEISDCRLFPEGGRAHFMTRRFDRGADGSKLHMSSLAGLAQLDYNQAGAHSYEGAFGVCRSLGLPMADVEELFRRMAFNVVARNQDDHVKNVAFLMNKSGVWSLSPAFDLTYAFNPGGPWTSRHQMTVNGKQDDFELADLEAVARFAAMKRGRAEEILEEVRAAVADWPTFAAEAGVEALWIERIERRLRLDLG